MKTSETLQRARQFIIDLGWTQGTMVADDGSVCAMGAISCAANGRINTDEFDEARDTLHSLLDTKYVADWNDEEDRTLEDVLEKFDEAISLAMSEEALNE